MLSAAGLFVLILFRVSLWHGALGWAPLKKRRFDPLKKQANPLRVKYFFIFATLSFVYP